MKGIQLTQGKIALVDDEDFEDLNQWEWYAAKNNNTFYAKRGIYSEGKRRQVLMHRQILNPPDDMQIDHEDHNGLNCQKNNLRHCTVSQNHWNSQLYRSNTSGFKGVSWEKESGKWVSYIKFNGKTKNLGRYFSKQQAALAYNKAAINLFGEFAYLNVL